MQEHLKITADHTQHNFGQSLGISLERAKQLNGIVEKLKEKEIKKSEVAEELSKIVETPAELFFVGIGYGGLMKESECILHKMGDRSGTLADMFAGRLRGDSLADLLGARLSSRRNPLEDLMEHLEELGDLLREDKEEHPYADIMDTFGDGMKIVVHHDGKVTVEGPDEEINASIRSIIEARIAKKKASSAQPAEPVVP